MIGFAVTAAFGRAQEIWKLDNLKQLGGHEVTVVGAPRVIDANGAKAVEFDGAKDGLFVSSLPVEGVTAFTIEVLFMPAEGGAAEQRFFHIEDANQRRALLEIRADGKGGWWLDEFLRSNVEAQPKGLPLIDPAKVHPTNRWYWVAMRFDGKHLVAYIDGAKELEGDIGHLPFGPGKTSLGVRQNLVYWFKGAIGEVRFHREAIAEEKLQRVRR